MANTNTIRLLVEGIDPFDGEYEIDPDVGFTNRELNIIKRISGVRAGELDEALKAGDNDLVLAITAVAVRQKGRDWQEFEKLAWEAPAGSITLPEDEVGADAVPLALKPPPPSGESETPTEPTGSLSLPSDGGDDLPETSPPATGSLHLATGAA